MVRIRLSHRTTRPPCPVASGPVYLLLPAHDEADRVAAVIDRLPAQVSGRETYCLVVDDGSADDTARRATAAGASVLSHGANRGLGAAVRTGIAKAVARGAAMVAFCDADGEYDPGELERLAQPILEGAADYVVGSRFAGRIGDMRPHRRIGNLVLTRALRLVARTPLTDGQSGFRALSRAAAVEAEIAHDYNYAQVLTIDLISKGFRYAEVPITYSFREGGHSFVRLGSYLRAVIPTVLRQLNPP